MSVVPFTNSEVPVYNSGNECVVHHFCDTSSLISAEGWRAGPLNLLERSCTSYRVYTRTGENGFDNGMNVPGTSIEIELPAFDTVFSFRVTAVNEGGESFPSETLAAGFSSGATGTVLVVNGFDRISGPAWFDRDGMAGVEWWNDRGVADQYNFIYGRSV
jgi:hypothetical protein